jgi:hypothetical protein
MTKINGNAHKLKMIQFPSELTVLYYTLLFGALLLTYKSSSASGMRHDIALRLHPTLSVNMGARTETLTQGFPLNP